ncbi:MAG: MBG domain-containing protein, partial [Chloroflexota bacterium]
MNTKFFIALRQASFKVLIAIVIVSMALTATSAQAAHTFGTTIRFTGNGNPLTQNYTIGATGTLLVVSIVTDGNAARTGGAPTYNGIALTQADVNRASGTETITELWYLVSPPTGAAYAISIPNTAPSRTLYVIASSYSAQAGFTSAFDVANGNTNAGSANPSVSVTTTANGDTIVAAMGNGNTAAPGARTGTNLFSVDNGSFSDNGQYSLQAAAGAIAMGWTVTTDDWGVVVAAFKEIPDTTITLVSDTNPSLAGQLVTFTATVTPAAATGTVTFYDGSTAIGSGALAGGVATFSTSALSSSSHNITAVYGGDATNGVSRSAVLVQVVNEVPVITSANTITFTLGQNNIFTATATGFPVPTWSAVAGLPAAVTFNTGTHVLSGIPAAGTVGSYPVTLSVTSAAGTDTQAFTLNVIKGPQTITFNALPAASYGGTFTINPVSNNGAGQPTGLTVAVAASGACSNVGNVISYNTLGTCTVVTSQVGNASYNAATPVTRTVQVNPAATNITITPSVNPSVLGQNVDFTVRVFSSGVPVTGGTVTITSCEWVVFFCAGGTNQTWGTYNLVGGVVVVSKADLPVERIGGNIVPSRITVTYNPTGNYNGSNTTLDQTVSTASTAVVLTSSINPSFFGQSVTFTATVTVSAPGAGSVSGGTVTFFDGATLLCTVANIPGNTAICTTATLVRGTHNITAHYQGTDQFGTSTSPILAQIVRRDSDIALISSLNPSVYGNTVTFTATVIDSSVPPVLPATTPTGTVSFYDDVTLLGTAALNGAGVATFNTSALIAGAHNITAVYNGDTFFVSGTSLIVIQTVTPATLTVTADNKSTIYGDNNVAFTVTYSGFVNAQTLATSDVTGAPACSTTATTASTVAGSPYPITCTIGSLNSNNYTFTFVDGNLAVTPKALTITADNQGKTYGFNLTFTGTEFTDSGLINADTITSVTLISAGAPAAAVNGSYPIVPSAAVGTGLGNYTITYVNGTLTVGGNLLIITANDFVGVNAKTYGQTLTFAGTEFTYFLAGGGVFLPGESLTSVTLSSLGTANNAPIGQYPIIPSNAVGTGLNNYVIIYRNGQLDVNQALLSFDPGNQTKTYGDTFTGYTGTFTGLMPFDNGVITPVYNSAGAPAIATVTAPGPVYPITVTFNDPNNRLLNYILTLDPVPAATLTVLPRTLTVTPTNRSKIYGDILTSADFAGTITGIQNSDNITATYDSPTGDPATAAIGGYPIVSTISDPGGMLGNYNLVAPDGTLTVTQRDLTITSNSQSKLYGENFTAFTGSVVGLQNGDVVTPTYDSVGAPATAAVGLYNITVLPLVGNTANYNLIYNIGTLSVLRQTLVFTPIDQTKIYGDTFTLFTGTITGLQNGDAITPNYSSPGAIATATVAGSPYPIVITLSDPTNKLNNYNYTINTGALTVTLRDLTVITDSKSKTYGTWFFAFTGSFTGIQNGDIITANYASAGSLPSAAVGVYPITATLNDPTGKLDNYNVTYNLGNLTVGSSVLTITADNKTITYGDPEPAFTFTYFGFAAGDTPAVVDTPPTCSVAGPHTDFGTYPIVCSGGVDNAYTFSYVAGTLTVNKRALVVTPTDKTKVFGDLFTAFTGTVTGVQAGDVITATYDSTGAPITAAVGNHPITTVLGDPGNRLGNYTVTINPATLTVTQRALTVTPADKTKIYGDVFTLFTGTITGIQNGDLITATYASPGAVTTATVAGSPYTITATLNAPAGVLANYNITLNTGSLTVTLRTLTVTPDNKGKVFGTLFTAFTGTVNGVQAGDNITATYASTGAPVNAAVGPYPITATLNDPNNR